MTKAKDPREAVTSTTILGAITWGLIAIAAVIFITALVWSFMTYFLERYVS